LAVSSRDLVAALSGESAGLAWRLLTLALTPLSLVHAAGLEVYLWPYRAGIRRRYRLPCVVVSIGNLASGGTGKTGMTLALVKSLCAVGLSVCVLIRGYRGATEHRQAVVSDGRQVLLDTDQAGDEAVLLARSLPGAPVIAGRDRRATGRIALDRFGPDVVVLDDAMQYYQLHRDVEIVLLDYERPFGNGWPIPAGILREPPGHLGRADWVVLTGSEPSGGSCLARCAVERVRRLARGAPILYGAYVPTELRALFESDRREVADLRGRPVATLCGLGNPLRFEDTVTSCGARIVHRTRFPDHHAPTACELEGCMRQARALGADWLVMTAKDAVKAPRVAPALQVWSLEASLVVSGMDAIVDTVANLVARRADAQPNAGGAGAVDRTAQV